MGTFAVGERGVVLQSHFELVLMRDSFRWGGLLKESLQFQSEARVQKQLEEKSVQLLI